MARNYLRFVGSRILQAVPVLFGLSVIVFVISRVVPGDPVRLMLGPFASDEAVARVTQEMALDEPLHTQFVIWLTGFVQGDWGMSLRTGNNVFHDVMLRLPATLELIVLALVLALLIAIPIGVIAGMNRNTWKDHGSRLIALAGVSVPRFWLAMVLQVVFVVWLDLFPLTGRISRRVERPPRITGFLIFDSAVTGHWTALFDTIHHLVLPVAALTLGTLAVLNRLIRSEMIEQQSKDYILAANVYGLPKNLIQYKYMLKNSLSSSMTILGLSFGGLIIGALYIELIYAYPGVARYGVAAIINQDFNAMVGIVVIAGIGYTLGNLFADLIYGYLDPRVRT